MPSCPPSARTAGVGSDPTIANCKWGNWFRNAGQIVFANQNGASRALYKGVYGGKDFQPRLGFAWTPAMLGGHTVLRGAFTISSYLEGTGTNLRLPINPPFNPAELDVPYHSVPLPATTASDGIVGTTSTGGSASYQAWGKFYQDLGARAS